MTSDVDSLLRRLLREFPYAEKFITRMHQRGVVGCEPDYLFGSTEEDREIIRRLNDAQGIQPCPQDHEHDGGCWSKETWDRAMHPFLYGLRNTQ